MAAGFLGSSAENPPSNRVEGFTFFEMGNFHLRTDKYITTNADQVLGPVR